MTITDAEWAVMELAWAKPGMTGREFVSSLTDSRGWSRSTTLTLLRRLEEKGRAALGERGQGAWLLSADRA